MTRAEAVKMLIAKVECIKRWCSGINEDCNSPDCGECALWYEQGNVKEQIEYLQMAIKALEAEPKNGKWKDSVLGMDGYYANCSECGYQIDVHKNRGYPNYCEHCGADMRGDAE